MRPDLSLTPGRPCSAPPSRSPRSQSCSLSQASAFRSRPCTCPGAARTDQGPPGLPEPPQGLPQSSWGVLSQAPLAALPGPPWYMTHALVTWLPLLRPLGDTRSHQDTSVPSLRGSGLIPLPADTQMTCGAVTPGRHPAGAPGRCRPSGSNLPLRHSQQHTGQPCYLQRWHPHEGCFRHLPAPCPSHMPAPPTPKPRPHTSPTHTLALPTGPWPRPQGTPVPPTPAPPAAPAPPTPGPCTCVACGSHTEQTLARS